MKALKIIGLVFLGLILVLTILLFSLPTKFNVERSITIEAPGTVVFDQVRYFKNFVNWSPWNDYDPNLTYKITENDGEVGAVYTWEGNDDVGKGTMTIESITHNRIDIGLRFTYPWESNDNSYYIFEETDRGIKVTMGMIGNMARPMNLMGLFMSMENMIGSDFEKGLKYLSREFQKSMESDKSTEDN